MRLYTYIYTSTIRTQDTSIYNTIISEHSKHGTLNSLKCFNEYYGGTIKSLNSRISPDLRNAILYTNTCQKNITLLMGKMHHLSSIMSFKCLNLLSSQSCQTSICFQVLIPFLIIMRRILSLNYISNDHFLYLNSHVALLVGSSTSLY